MNKEKSYRDLAIWQKSMKLGESIYRFSMTLPVEEPSGLAAHMVRAAISIPSYIAEGFGRQAFGQYRHHLCLAQGFLLELEKQINLCRLSTLNPSEERDSILNEISELNQMLAAIIERLS